MLLLLLNNLKNLLQKIINYLVILLFAIIVIVINFQIFFRYVIRKPLFWSMEVAQLSFIYLAILGGSLALLSNEYTKVEFFINMIPPKMAKFFEIIVHILILIFFTITGFNCQELIYKAKITTNITPALSIPMDYIYRALQIGCFIFAFFALTKILISIFSKNTKEV
ncbi:MAG: hypothetical protein Kow00103_09000 [Candidatus Caldatribacteriota bacterium]